MTFKIRILHYLLRLNKQTDLQITNLLKKIQNCYSFDIMLKYFILFLLLC